MLIGKVLKPQGIKGEIKVTSYLDSVEGFKKIKSIIINNTTYQIENCRLSGTIAYLKLKGIDSINTAETLRDSDVTIRGEDKPKLPQDRFYIDDLIGCDVYADDDYLGKLEEILQYGSADIYVLSGKDAVSFPAIKKAIKKIDISNKKIELIKEEFEKIAVYQD